tara:strand:+ start:172 stop:321 length:150 start_codon:yes stop_codon:yes gene_type:complete
MDDILKEEIKKQLKEKFKSSTNAVATQVSKASLDDEELNRLLDTIEELE